jgi:hypothetical protein
MADIKKKKVSELPEATDPSGFWIFGSKTVGGVITSVRFAFDKITSLFGVSQEKGQSITLAPSQKLFTDEIAQLIDTAKDWSADVGLTYPATRVHGSKIYRVKSGQTTTAADEPSDSSTVWELIGGGNDDGITPFYDIVDEATVEVQSTVAEGEVVYIKEAALSGVVGTIPMFALRVESGSGLGAQVQYFSNWNGRENYCDSDTGGTPIVGKVFTLMTDGSEWVFDGVSLNQTSVSREEFESVKEKTDAIAEVIDNDFCIVDEEGNIALKVQNGKTSFIQEEDNLRENMQKVGAQFDADGNLIVGDEGGHIIDNVGNPGEFCLIDENNYIGLKLSSMGELDFAKLGALGKSVVAKIANSVINGGVEMADVSHIINYGQSLSVGQTERLISATQSNPLLLCFDGVQRTSSYDLSLTGDAYPTNRRIAFAPLVERTNDGTSAGLLMETPATGIGEMFAQSYAESTMLNMDKQLLVTSPGWGSSSLANLSKGTAGYVRLIEDVQAAYNLSVASGKTYRCLAVTFTQGENDYLSNTSIADYKTQLKKLIVDLNDDIKAITNQEDDVVLVTYQLATAMNASRDYPSIALALFEASQEDANIYMATPMYHLTHKDGWHLNALSSKLLGAYYGDVVNKIMIDKKDYKPLHITNATVSGNNIILTYNNTSNLAFAAANGITLPNKGFTFSDASSIITNVEITAANAIKITCSSSPAGKTLQYGVNWEQAGAAKLNIGNVRDSAGNERKFKIEGVSQSMHNWAVIQEITL